MQIYWYFDLPRLVLIDVVLIHGVIEVLQLQRVRLSSLMPKMI